MMCEMVRGMVKKQALACGFETRLQADGSEGFDANVYAFAQGVLFDVGRQLCVAFAQVGITPAPMSLWKPRGISRCLPCFAM